MISKKTSKVLITKSVEACTKQTKYRSVLYMDVNSQLTAHLKLTQHDQVEVIRGMPR